MDRVPATTFRALLEGLGAVGLSAQELARDVGLPADLSDADLGLPGELVTALWRRALELAPREELGVEVGLEVPLGMFGAMDYLATSADTVGGAFRSLARHFPAVAPGRWIEIEASTDVYRVAFPCAERGESAWLGDEFTLGIMVHHFRTHAEELPLRVVELSRERGRNPERFAELLGASVSFGHATAALRFEARAPDVPLVSRDPLLRQTLETMTSRLGLVPGTPPFELAVRAELRKLLPSGRPEAAEVARRLGMSERSLQRRLAEIERGYLDVLDAVLRAEAERLLLTTRAGMAEIALLLGFADQSAFSRAFKRWTSSSPREWRAERA